MSISSVFGPVSSLLSMLLLKTPEGSGIWVIMLLWVARFMTFGLLLRTYIIPWTLARMSRHVRIRSISLRSIRGLYLRRGRQTIRIERISYVWYGFEIGITIKVEGLNVEVYQHDRTPAPRQSHRRSATVETISHVRRQFWNGLSALYAILDPVVRPVIRACVMSCLGVFVRWLPSITQQVTLEFQPATLIFPNAGNAKVSAETVYVHTNLKIANIRRDNHEKEHSTASRDRMTRLVKPLQASYSVSAWKHRLGNSFRRSWNRVVEQTQGHAILSMNLTNITGSIPVRTSTTDATEGEFLSFPGLVDFSTTLSFDPQSWTIITHSSNTTLNVRHCVIELDRLRSLFDLIQTKNKSHTSPHSSSYLFPPGSQPASPLSSAASASDSAPSIFSDTPTSPFMKAFSQKASVLRRRYLYPPCMKLRETKNPALIAFLCSFTANVSGVTLNSRNRSENESYKMNLQGISFSVALSNPLSNPLHRQCLGKSVKSDVFDPDVYSLSFHVENVKLDRYTTRHYLRILVADSIDVRALVSQFPSPWLFSTPFIGGDPNGPLLVITLNIGGIQVTERADVLATLFSTWTSPPRPLKSTSALPATVGMPRFVFEASCGIISARLLYQNEETWTSKAVEMRTDGFSVACTSLYTPIPMTSVPQKDFDTLPLSMAFTFNVTLQPVFIRIRPRHSQNSHIRLPSLTTSDDDFCEDPVFLSVESFDLSGRGTLLGAINDDTRDIATMNMSTLTLDLAFFTEAVVAELWHLSVQDAISHLITLFPKATKRDASPSRSPLHSLPPGINASLFVGRSILFITSPDINPDDTMELSRGVACRAERTVLQLRCTRRHDACRPTDTAMSERRNKLYLPERTIAQTVLDTETSDGLEGGISGFICFQVGDLSLRDALATQYVADDPFMAERDHPTLSSRKIFSTRLLTEVSWSSDCDRNAIHNLHVNIHLPDTKITFSLTHAYHILLANRCLALLNNRPTASSYRAPQRTSKAMPSIRVRITLDTVQLSCELPHERIALRLDSITATLSPQIQSEIKFERLVAWVHLSSPANRWQEDEGGKWKEIVHLRSWRVWDSSTAMLTSVHMEGQSARFRLPYGYVFSNLVQDATVSLKALKHLYHMTVRGSYSEMPSPEAEGPKCMPHMTLTVASFCVEVADDPFEGRLNLAWRAGLEAAKVRVDREQAYEDKVATIINADVTQGGSPAELRAEYLFSSKHSVSIEDARQRLYKVHSMDWGSRLGYVQSDQVRNEDVVKNEFHSSFQSASRSRNIVDVSPDDSCTPLFRALIRNLSLSTAPPSFPASSLPEYLYEQGSLPQNTEFTLLLPFHLNFTLSSLRMTIRDYALPLFDLPPHEGPDQTALTFDTDLVIAEELAGGASVDWVLCPVSYAHDGIHGAAPLSISVPKTIMPVKSYANPEILVSTPHATLFSWGMSYGPATQDLMKVLDTITSTPRDSSPGLGFWDKLRLIFHWSVRTSFKGEVRFHMKGLRDPHEILGKGAGFALSWQGNAKLLIGRHNDDKELVQVISDSMMIVIPNFHRSDSGSLAFVPESRPFKKICAKVLSGVRFGVGFVLERSCGFECRHCSGSAFHRKCRSFNFKPHYGVILEKKKTTPEIKGPDDSYNGFRSDFIHLSVSLTSSVRSTKTEDHDTSGLYLTPKAFAHFWSWWSLFDAVMSLPIRQGSYYPRRTISPKFGRHIATLKYRVSIRQLSIMHGYIDNGRETWADGVTPWIGVKGKIDEFQVDMHQRDQETLVPGLGPHSTKVLRRKPFYAAEVVLKGLDLRAILGIFADPKKQLIPVNAPQNGSNYRTRNDYPTTPIPSAWYDPDDFVETDWSSSLDPTFHVLPVVGCSHFMFFKRNDALVENPSETSKFGNEDSHVCLLGKEPSVPEVQAALTSLRIEELKGLMRRDNFNQDKSSGKKVFLLEKYISRLHEPYINPDGKDASSHYQMPSDSVSPDEWAEFDNVYQIHCPKFFMDAAVRDIMMQYYYCSRDRKGLEYHMASRAVKFVRDQANELLRSQPPSTTESSTKNAAHAAASALKHMFVRDDSDSEDSTEYIVDSDSSSSILDPLHGWSDGVSLKKGHCCLLLKPQVVLQNREKPQETCVVAALQAKLQSFTIMDDSNAKDPISGKVMSRTYAVLSGMQTFAPTARLSGDGSVPLEVLIDFRCESDEFDRLVPQTDATFHYDKFNRLRLRNNVTSVVTKSSAKRSSMGHTHLQDQTDLIKVITPRFTVSASDQHFKTISNIVTKLLLFSDATHKTRVDRLETLLFTYDFTDYASACRVITDLQGRLRKSIEVEELAVHTQQIQTQEDEIELLKLKAHIYLLGDELNFIFDAIKQAQDRFDDQTDRKSALLLNASSSEISWNMMDEQQELLAKHVVQDIDYYWLSRQDSSTYNDLAIGSLQAFDGSKDAVWTEILSKYNEPPNHPLLKRGLFLVAKWSVLPPVGGIGIYEFFELNLHPMRLQIDARVGRRIMEYLWPGRRDRKKAIQDSPSEPSPAVTEPLKRSFPPSRSLDATRKTHSRQSSDSNASRLVPPMALRRLGTSRSFSNLRDSPPPARSLPRTRSSEALGQHESSTDHIDPRKLRRGDSRHDSGPVPRRGDAAEMRTRSSQKTFVLVKISSLHLLLSIMKEESFVCRDARITTRDLEYRNQTWSFEELVDQLIPSDTSWKGWIKMAFHQPLVPVLPVAREIFSKTKWIATKNAAVPEFHHSALPTNSSRQNLLLPADDDTNRSDDNHDSRERLRTPSPHRGWRKASKRKSDTSPHILANARLYEEPETLPAEPIRSSSRNRMLSLLGRKKKDKSGNATDSTSKNSTVTRRSMESGDGTL
ncbi:hypothetical protein ARMSODRAFT_953107 [Armillaria solidipes]|uniref:Golgi-body localization protein domain-containing protein n=1 Tax=Armillaria solidipes TaxID=1076256 RepID=A0A2H3CBP2_9AGAR|nr:hypothetical protein ARMSODRAFT_953107 [Armillaria solidipes]